MSNESGLDKVYQDDIYVVEAGALAHDMGNYSEEFLRKMEELVDMYGTVKIKMPSKYFTKKEVAELGIELGVPVSETFSCQTNSQGHCGSCPNCVDREEHINRLLVPKTNSFFVNVYSCLFKFYNKLGVRLSEWGEMALYIR